MSGDTTSLLRFSPFVSCVDPSFWHRLSQLKLEVDRLNENEHQIWGYYSNKSQEGLNHIFSVDATSFNKHPDESRLSGCGKVINKNTIEGYKDMDKLEMLKNEGAIFMEIIKTEAIHQPSLLNTFTLLCFADLKQYVFHYRFLFLAPTFISYNLIGQIKVGQEELKDSQMRKICSGYDALSPINKSFFLIRVSGDDLQVVTVKEGLSQIDGENSTGWIFGFADSCDSDNPGWSLRNYLAFISYHCPQVIESPLKVLCWRLQLIDGNWQGGSSLILNVKVNIKDGGWKKAAAGEDWVGWERNEKGQVASKSANLRSLLDPMKLAESSVDLNLKLMKWQLLPDLDLDIIKNTKCLLLGAGTLGCAVARNLLSWGVHKITFVDYGNVSYSNPVRQSLFKFKDAGASKAKTAASALKEICPNVDAKGVVMCIPMPGHPIGQTLRGETEKTIKTLEDLTDEHDVIFLLMDSRESRWLPTLLAAAKKKLVINSALGFDSFLVMRHGLKSSEPVSNEDPKVLMGSQLGCYFCNDVTAPGNSGKSRTLDQQCTVTRPGLSNIAGGLVVELLVSILQHPLGGQAPAESDPDATATGLLGIVPHTIRGFISHYQFVLPATEAFKSCVACSQQVINEYQENNLEFILKAVESKEYLEDLCELRKLLEQSLMSEVLEYSDTESESGH